MRVPAELVLLIAEDLAQLHAAASLARLSLASSQIYGLLTPILYRSLLILTPYAAQTVHSTLITNTRLAAHVQQVFLARMACHFFTDPQPSIFGFCAHMVAVEFQAASPGVATAFMDSLSAAPILRRLAVSYMVHQPLGMLKVLARHAIAPLLEDFHLSCRNTRSRSDIHHLPQDYSALGRLRTFSCAYAADTSRSPDALDSELVRWLLQPCEALASLPSLEHLCIFIHPAGAAEHLRDGRFCTALGRCERRGLRITLSAAEDSDLRSIVEREVGWSHTGRHLLARPAHALRDT